MLEVLWVTATGLHARWTSYLVSTGQHVILMRSYTSIHIFHAAYHRTGRHTELMACVLLERVLPFECLGGLVLTVLCLVQFCMKNPVMRLVPKLGYSLPPHNVRHGFPMWQLPSLQA